MTGHGVTLADKEIGSQDMLLLDMGCEYYAYDSDITCSFPASGRFSEEQSLVYEAVLAAHQAVIAAMKPGVSWPVSPLSALSLSQSAAVEARVTGNYKDQTMVHEAVLAAHQAVIAAMKLGEQLACKASVCTVSLTLITSLITSNGSQCHLLQRSSTPCRC